MQPFGVALYELSHYAGRVLFCAANVAEGHRLDRLVEAAEESNTLDRSTRARLAAVAALTTCWHFQAEFLSLLHALDFFSQNVGGDRIFCVCIAK
jgi:hypothetical protein